MITEIKKDRDGFSLVPFVFYNTFWEKLQALKEGKILLLRGLERQTVNGALIRLEESKHVVTQISYELREKKDAPRQWILYNLGFNDLSLYTALEYNEDIVGHTNKFQINDLVKFKNEDGKMEGAFVEEVWVSNVDKNHYAYKLSRSNELQFEENIVKP